MERRGLAPSPDRDSRPTLPVNRHPSARRAARIRLAAHPDGDRSRARCGSASTIAAIGGCRGIRYNRATERNPRACGTVGIGPPAHASTVRHRRIAAVGIATSARGADREIVSAANERCTGKRQAEHEDSSRFDQFLHVFMCGGPIAHPAGATIAPALCKFMGRWDARVFGLGAPAGRLRRGCAGVAGKRVRFRILGNQFRSPTALPLLHA